MASNRKWILAMVATTAVLLGWFLLRAEAPSPQTQETTDARPPRSPGGPIVRAALPATLSEQEEIGARAYEAVCAACHGAAGTGRWDMGPPLVHKIYEPSHHGDESFQIAVSNGVRAHHWRFGNMPPQPGLSRADVGAITAYIRAIQRANGIH